MPPQARKTATGRLIGYARVSTEDQGTDPQTDECLFFSTIRNASMLLEQMSNGRRVRIALEMELSLSRWSCIRSESLSQA